MIWNFPYKGYSSYMDLYEDNGIEDDGWKVVDSKRKEIREKDCPLIEDWRNTVPVRINPVVVSKILTLAKEVETEWIAYFLGTKGATIRDLHITDLFVPKQTVAPATCSANPDDTLPDNVIGWVHSHNTMGAFFSSQDDSTAKQHLITMVINKKGEYKVQVKLELPCHSYKFLPVSFLTVEEGDYSEFVKESKTKMESECVKREEVLVQKHAEHIYNINKEGLEPLMTRINRIRNRTSIGKDGCPFSEDEDSCWYLDKEICGFPWSNCPYGDKETTIDGQTRKDELTTIPAVYQAEDDTLWSGAY